MPDPFIFLKKHAFKIGLLAITISFCFSRFIFVLYCPLIDIWNDAPVYMHLIPNALRTGTLPDLNFIPLGYPLIAYIISSLFEAIMPIIFFQNIITYLSCISLLYFIRKYNSQLIYPLATALSIFLMSSYNADFDGSIMSESVYISTILLLASFLLPLIYNPNSKKAVTIGFLLFLLLMFRPTGVFGGGLCLVLILYFLIAKKIKVALTVLFSYSSFLLLISVYNYIASGEFPFISLSRSKGELNNDKHFDNELALLTRAKDPEKPSFRKAYKQYYWIEQKRRYDAMLSNYYIYYFFEWEEQKNYLNRSSLFSYDNDFYSMVVTYRNQFEPENERPLINCHNYRKTIAYKIYNYYLLHIANVFFRNFFWVVLFFIAFTFLTIITTHSKLTLKSGIWLLMICLINIGHNSVHIFTTHRSLMRYEYPTEVILYIVGLCFPILAFEYWQEKVKKDNVD